MPDDSVPLEWAEPARKPSNPVDTSGAGGHSALAFRTLRELQVGRPGGISFSSSHQLNESNARAGQGKGVADTSVRASEQAGLFGSGLNSDATQRQNVDRLPVEAVTPTGSVRMASTPVDELSEQDRDVASDNTYAIAEGRGKDLDRNPSLVSKVLRWIRENRVAVISVALMGLTFTGGLLLMTRRGRYT